MKMMDFVVKGAIIANLQSTERNAVIKEMVQGLVAAGALEAKDGDEIAKAIADREKQGSTGFGKGVAVPHVKHEKVPKMMAAVARSAAGIDFAALDRAPVYSVFMILSPKDKPEAHLQAMESIFRHLTRDNFRRFLRQSETSAAILDLIQEADQQSAG